MNRASPSTPRRPAARERRAAVVVSCDDCLEPGLGLVPADCDLWIGDGDDRVVQMREPQRAEGFPERDVVVDRQQSPGDVDGQERVRLPERVVAGETRDSSRRPARRALSQPTTSAAASTSTRARTRQTPAPAAMTIRRVSSLAGSCVPLRCASTARADRRSARAPRAPRTRARRGSAARAAVSPARRLSVAVSPGARAGASNAPSGSECPRRLAARPSTARARRRAARCRSASDLRSARVSAGTSSGAVSRSLTSRTDPSCTPSRSSIVLASSSAAEICVPARNVCVHGFTGCPSRGGTSSRSTGRS